MSNLFSKGKIIQEVQAIAGLDISDKIVIVQKLYEEYKNGNADDETRYEQNFNQLFFNELLGYTRNDHMHPKAGTPVGGKIADLGLGLFREGKYNFDDVQLVVELKGAKIFLDKKQNRQNPQSPVDQGFGYKTSFKNCKRLIVSNFHQIRLYRDNKQDYEERNIAELARGDDNFFQLRKLLMLLGAKYLLSSGGESRTEKLVSQFRIDQQKITKKFYQDYKGLRLELINDMKHRNPDLSVELLVEKAQKIIDRLVFVHFCEDKGLLPADKLKENIVRAHEAGFTPWEILKKFFVLVDKGSESLGNVGGYNGELFKSDAVLDGLDIGDAICKKFIDLGDYDFDDELSVNILGHIFEQSISDLEQLKIDLLGTEVETDELVENKKQSKRKKDGIFYTPEYIVDYIVQNSLMKYLSEKEDACLAKYKDEQKAYQAYQQILQNVKVLDPACGSGAFLVKVFDVLYAENQRVGKLIGALFDESNTYKNILTNNIYGVDLNPESVEITKLSLWLKSAQKGKKLNNLDTNIKCGNSLIDDPAVAGERAFDWHKEFASIMAAGGFDVIVGNPPYVRIQNLDTESKLYFDKNYISAHKNYDLYLLFVEKAYQIVSVAGKVSYIMPKKFITTDYGEKLKNFLYDKQFLDSFIDFGTYQVFDDATTYTGLFIFDKKQKKHFFYKKIENQENFLIGFDFSKLSYDSISESNWILVDMKQKKIFDALNNFPVLSSFTEKVFQGLVTGVDSIFIMEYIGGSYYSKETKKYYDFGNSDIIFPLLKGSEIGRYEFPNPQYVIIYPYSIVDGKAKLIDEELLKSKYSLIYSYLKESESKLRAREKGKFDNKNWYSYSRNQNISCMPIKKVLTQVLSKRSALTMDEDGKYFFVGGGTAGGYGILLKEDSGLSYKYLLGLLNSKLLERYLHQYSSPFNGGYYAYSRATMEKLPIKKIPLKDQQPFIDKADQMLSLNKEFHNKKSSALSLLQAEYGIDKVSRKLEHFYEGDFADFLKALGVKTLSLDKKEELMGWFTKKKEELMALKHTIDQTDREIDGMVYELYGLSEEEVRVVEGR